MAAADLCARLLAVVRGQIAALEADDFDRFGRFSDERDALTEALGRLDGALLGADERLRLEQARALAARAEQAAARLRQETVAELGSLRRGATALHGYARPGTELGRYSRHDHQR